MADDRDTSAFARRQRRAREAARADAERFARGCEVLGTMIAISGFTTFAVCAAARLCDVHGAGLSVLTALIIILLGTGQVLLYLGKDARRRGPPCP